MNKIILVLFSTLLLANSPVNASGSSNYDYGSTQKSVDQAYEYGKALYKGRVKSVGKIAFCLTQGDQVVKSRRSSLKAFKGGSAQNLANNLVDCNNPEQLIISKIGNDKTRLLLHYLNKRYKLKLH